MSISIEVVLCNLSPHGISIVVLLFVIIISIPHGVRRVDYNVNSSSNNNKKNNNSSNNNSSTSSNNNNDNSSTTIATRHPARRS